MKTSTLLGLVALLALSSCASYQERAINLDTNSAQWAQLSEQLCPKGKRLDKENMQQIALLLNPELRQARLKLAQRDAVAAQAGYWDDPELSLDVVRILQEHITNGGVGAGFTLPITGLPKLAVQIATCYKESDFLTLAAQERDLLTQLEELHAKLLVNHAKLELQSNQLRQLRSEDARLEQLHQLGEIEFAALQISKQRIFDNSEEGRMLESEHLQLHLELTKLMGLHPTVRDVEMQERLPSGIPSAKSAVSAQDLLDSPSLLAKRSDYAASELEFKAEIRKQYPELGLSPAVEREDGNIKLGVGFSFSIPAWNRNRVAVAESQANRDLIGDAFINEYRRLLTAASALSDQQQLALQHCRSEAARREELQRKLATQLSLYELGEIEFNELAETRHELYQRKIAYLSCLQELLLTQIQIKSLNPHNKI